MEYTTQHNSNVFHRVREPYDKLLIFFFLFFSLIVCVFCIPDLYGEWLKWWCVGMNYDEFSKDEK